MNQQEANRRERTVEALRVFNEKVTRLAGLSFIKSIQEAGKMSLSVGGGAGRGFPQGEPVQAFVLTYRLFFQDNERISLRNIATLYETPGISAEHKARFDAIRQNLNSYLDEVRNEVDGRPFTQREVMDVFVYGELAHTNKQKKAIYDIWAQNDTILAMLEFTFVQTILEVHRFLKHIMELNENVLSEL